MADDFGKKVERFGQDIWKKTSDAFGVISKSTEIAGKQREMRLVYAEIGKKYFELHANAPEEAFSELFETARAKADELKKLEEQLLQYKGYRRCAVCGETISASVAYCPRCGAEQPKDEPSYETEPDEDADADWICPRCGIDNDMENLFCVACGEKRS